MFLPSLSLVFPNGPFFIANAGAAARRRRVCDEVKLLDEHEPPVICSYPRVDQVCLLLMSRRTDDSAAHLFRLYNKKMYIGFIKILLKSEHACFYRQARSEVTSRSTDASEGERRTENRPFRLLRIVYSDNPTIKEKHTVF